jgi:hypothetical protein
VGALDTSAVTRKILDAKIALRSMLVKYMPRRKDCDIVQMWQYLWSVTHQSVSIGLIGHLNYPVVNQLNIAVRHAHPEVLILPDANM